MNGVGVDFFHVMKDVNRLNVVGVGLAICESLDHALLVL